MTTNWSANVYSQERKVVRLTDFNASTAMVRLAVASLNISADYYIPTSRVLEIDVTDIVRMTQTGTISLTGYNSTGTAVSGETASCFYGRAGRINPATDIIPRSVLLDDWERIADEHMTTVDVSVAPPSRVLEHVNGQAITLEFIHNVSTVSVFPSGSTTPLSQQGQKFVTIPNMIYGWRVENVDAQGCVYGEYGVTERDGCRNYCVVRWLSRYGTQKQLVWEYRDLRVKVSETVDIEKIDGAYDERKGYVQGLTLYLDELNAYDYWYYSDIVTSSSVEVYIVNKDTFVGAWYPVQVENKEVTIPNFDTGEPNKLEVQINIRKYDAI